MRRALWIGSLIALIGLVNGTVRGQQESVETPEQPRDRLVLLNSGRIMSGCIMRNAGGYLLDQNNGKVQIATEDVKCVVDSLHEGYCKQRDSIVEPTPATHLALANWCISYRLYDEASDELKKCLKADPENVAARRLLQRLTDTIRATLPPDVVKTAPRKTSEGFIQPDVESLGGLSRDAALQFVTRIQPLMLHKCGNASCHGVASANDFKVYSPRIGGHGSRQTAERNLAEVFRQIDFDDVLKSKILDAFKGAHGGKGSIFIGQSAAEQRKTLQMWVRNAAQEKRAEKEALERPPQLLAQNKSKKLPKAVQSRNLNPFQPVKPFVSDVRQASFSPDDDEDERLVEASDLQPKELKPDPNDAAALAREPEDAFDPERFNKRSHRP